MWQLQRGLYRPSGAFDPAPGGGGGGGLSLDFTGGSLPAGATLTRSSSATYVNSSGVLSIASTNVARFDYLGGAALGILIEPAATNLWGYSNNFESGWVPALGTTGKGTSPDGTTNAYRHSDSSPEFNLATSAAAYTMSSHNKQLNSTSFKLGVNGAGSTFTLTGSGTVASNDTGFVGVIRAMDNGFYRVATTKTVGTDSYFKLFGGAYEGVYIYGYQLEIGSVATSYIPTTGGTQASRSADVLTFTIPGGITSLLYTFDNNSTQSVSVSSGAYTVPTNLNRPRIKSIVGS